MIFVHLFVNKQCLALTPNDNLSHAVPNEQSISNTFYINPVTPNEIINTLTSLFESYAIGIDGLRPYIIKTTTDQISFRLSYIFNLSFS